MKKYSKIKNLRNFVFAMISLFLALPYILIFNGSLPLFIGGFVALLLTQVCFNTSTFIVEENKQLNNDREKNITRLLGRPNFVMFGKWIGGAPPIQNLNRSDEGRCIAFSWMIIAFIHLVSATFIEDSLAYSGPMQFQKYFPVWLLIILLAVWDIGKHLYHIIKNKLY